MTLHSAKGLEFDTVFLPGWEEGLFPSQRTLDEQGRAGLEEERRLAHVGLTRARKRAKIYFATNRRIHGLWQTNIPSRFLDELPEAQRRGDRSKGGFGGYGGLRRLALRRHDGVRLELRARPAGSARRRTSPTSGRDGFSETARRATATRHRRRRRPCRPLPGGERSERAKPDRVRGARRVRRGPAPPAPAPAACRSPSRASWSPNRPAPSPTFTVGDRVFHQKFGNGNVTAVDGNKLTIAFDKAGEKRVVDSFVERV